MNKPKFYDCLKYWKVIRQWVKVRYGLNQADLDMLLFLYTESYFKKNDFNNFNNILSWDVSRFDRMLRDGWIERYRKAEKSKNQVAVYTLSYKCKRMIYSIYQKLSGEEIPENKTNNPMYHRNVSFTNKVYRNYISTINAQRKAARINSKELGQHLSPEL